FTAGTMRSSILGLVLIDGFAIPASAADAPTNPLAISGNVDVTTDYVFRGYWNIGLTLAVWDQPALTFDVRYWDTNASGCTDNQIGFSDCGSRVVGTMKASF
ncbi:MAG: hypothetical protein WA884_18665, partial [Methyloceanibacter sp.]